MTLNEFLSSLEGVKRTDKSEYMALCPAHADHNPSLSIKEADGKILINCFASCTNLEILKAMGLSEKDLFPDNGGMAIYCGKSCQPVNHTKIQLQNRVDIPMSTIVNGVNLEELSTEKKLPIDFLESLGIRNMTYLSKPTIKIPYFSEDHTEIAVRFRTALTGDCRFKWRKGDHAMPYGLDRLKEIREAGWVILVEGESDSWTCWLHEIPAIGIPGKSIWQESWAKYFEGLQVYIWQEPDAEDFVLRILKDIPDLKYIEAPENIKDISEAQCKGLDIPSWLQELTNNAENGQALMERINNEKLAVLYDKAKHIIEAEDPLECIKTGIRELGYGGDIKPPVITYLSATSRLLEMRDGTIPVHLLLLGPSSCGKTYTLSTLKRLLPKEAYHIVEAGSARVLIYDKADLKHRLLLFSEADSLPAGEDNPAASAIRNMLQDHHLHYQVTVKDKATSDFTVRTIDKPGPTVLITTSTRPLGEQLMTRLFTLEISDSKEQITASLQAQSSLEIGGLNHFDNALVDFQAYLQLKTPIKVIVPFARELADAISQMSIAPRINRDYGRLINLIKSVVVLRQYQRKMDDDERLVATLKDYDTVRGLVNDMYVDSSSGVTANIRKLVTTVASIHTQSARGNKITNTTLSKELDLSVKQITRLAKKAIKHGWLVNQELKKSYPADYTIGEPMPETEGLPVLNVDSVDTVGIERVKESSLENEGFDTLTPVTAIIDILSPLNTEQLDVGKAIQIWHSKGSPMIPLGPGDNCSDLEKLLSHPNTKPAYLKAVGVWLEKIQKSRVET